MTQMRFTNTYTSSGLSNLPSSLRALFATLVFAPLYRCNTDTAPFVYQ
jgi:hypothetical protein